MTKQQLNKVEIVFDTRKYCPMCKRTLDSTWFCINRARHDGLKVYCKGCDKVVARQDYLKVKLRHPFRLMKNAIDNRCNNPSHNGYKYYGGKGIKNFLSIADIKNLWYRDQGWLLAEPSIDRINAKGDYVYGNCRFIEMSENRARVYRDHI